jgi:hypothetical protein
MVSLARAAAFNSADGPYKQNVPCEAMTRLRNAFEAQRDSARAINDLRLAGRGETTISQGRREFEKSRSLPGSIRFRPSIDGLQEEVG